ncbi:cupin domain-containing protein [Halioxenophilus aromaticivorans]|uniref:Cupin domain-containing protein n=1 Tax=Halioxenophilus aromaticivorans TaxID=1306992 RepID=A0AAV3U3T5_9ALTE
MQTKAFVCAEGTEKEDLGGGITRQVLGYNEQIMMVKVWFEQGSEGYIHSHFHSQVTYIAKGRFEVTVGDEVKTLEEGDCFFMEPNIAHGALCKEAGLLIDVFSPCREDFIKANSGEN